MNSAIGGTPSPRNNRTMWRTQFGNSSNSVPPSGFPHSSKVGSFRYPQMRELRTRERWEAAANALRIQPAPLGHPLDRGREDRRRPLEWVVGYFGSFKDILIQSDPDDSSQHS